MEYVSLKTQKVRSRSLVPHSAGMQSWVWRLGHCVPRVASVTFYVLVGQENREPLCCGCGIVNLLPGLGLLLQL